MPRFIVLERDTLMPVELQWDPNVVQLGTLRLKYGQHPNPGCCPNQDTRRGRSGHWEIWGRGPSQERLLDCQVFLVPFPKGDSDWPQLMPPPHPCELGPFSFKEAAN